MNDELRAHLDELTERNLAAGMPPEEARYSALRAFGGVAQITERARDERRSMWGEQAYQDVRYGVRQLRKTPGFTAVVVLSLALGIGANTAVFSVLNEVLLRPLPVRDPDELILLDWSFGPRGMQPAIEQWNGEWMHDASSGRTIGSTTFTLRAFETLREGSSPYAELVAVGVLGGGGYVVIDGAAEDGSCQLVSDNYHTMLGVDAAIGRTLAADDDRAEAEPVAVLSHAYWQRRFNADPAVIGRTVLIHNLSVTIVGVTRPRFFGTEFGWSPDFTLPLSALGKVQAPQAIYLRRRASEIAWLHVMGRLKQRVSRAEAVSEMETAFHVVVRERAASHPQKSDSAERERLPRLAVREGAQGLTGIRKASTTTLFILSGLVGAVLLIACLNVATLLLARAAARQREIAVRLAMGASRARIVRQLLTESGLLAALGAVLGLLFAVWGKEALLFIQPLGFSDGVPKPVIDGSVLTFTAALTLATTVLFGLAPALHTANADVNANFKGAAPGLQGRSRIVLRLGRSLMVLQVALSLVVLIGAALFARTLHNLRHTELGFNRDNLVMFGLRAKPRRYTIPELTQVVQRIEERLATLPGVGAATFSRLPIGALDVNPIFVQGATVSGKLSYSAAHNAIAPTYFATLEIPLLLGRGFTLRDDAGAPKVAVINHALARMLFGDDNPIGRRFGRTAETAGEIEIIGVVRDARLSSPRDQTWPMLYEPFLQKGNAWVNFSVRTRGDAAAMLPAVRQAVRDIDPEMIVVNLRTQETHLDQFVFRERMLARLSTFFGVLVLALVCIGLYGLMSYAVTRRTSEIGIRMALGALPRRVLWIILREAFLLVCAGATLGVGGALAATRLIQNQLYGLSPTDPASYGTVVLLLAGVAVLACLLPARRAANVDPVVALRSE